jgi:hypothetical protein
MAFYPTSAENGASMEAEGKGSGSWRNSLVSMGVTLAAVLGLWLSPVWAGEARLDDVVVTNTKKDLLVYFTVVECFTPEMRKAIENGIKTTFTFFVKLDEVRSLWFDREIADLKVSHEIQYDGLKKVYQIRLMEQSGEPIHVTSFDEAQKLVTEVAGLMVTPLHNLEKGKRYQIRMMAELDKIELPFYLHYVLFFLSLWDFETDWYVVDFRY